jgi:periplasmic divalent cation tolerance protein
MTNSSNQAVIIFTTSLHSSQAELIAHCLVEKGLAACVQIIDRVRSVYRWEGRIESAAESLLLIKSQENMYLEVERVIQAIHRVNGWYETPEVLKVPVTGGSEDYLNWLFESLGKSTDTRFGS